MLRVHVYAKKQFRFNEDRGFDGLRRHSGVHTPLFMICTGYTLSSAHGFPAKRIVSLLNAVYRAHYFGEDVLRGLKKNIETSK